MSELLDNAPLYYGKRTGMKVPLTKDVIGQKVEELDKMLSLAQNLHSMDDMSLKLLSDMAYDLAGPVKKLYPRLREDDDLRKQEIISHTFFYVVQSYLKKADSCIKNNLKEHAVYELGKAADVLNDLYHDQIVPKRSYSCMPEFYDLRRAVRDREASLDTHCLCPAVVSTSLRRVFSLIPSLILFLFFFLLSGLVSAAVIAIVAYFIIDYTLKRKEFYQA